MSMQALAQEKSDSTSGGSTPRRGVLQRKCACGGSAGPSGECSACGRKRLNGGRLQTKLRIGAANDPLEKEADRVADQIMRMSTLSEVPQASLPVQRVASRQGGGEVGRAPASVERVLAGTGRPLERNLRLGMERRFGYDFSEVRVHSDMAAAESARDIGARAYTAGNHVVFGKGQYEQGSHVGRRLLAHELTHVVQQGVARPMVSKSREDNDQQNLLNRSVSSYISHHFIRRVPGNGMLPPGDCSWATYLVLRGSVETAKAVVSTLGACSVTDSCTFLAAKIAAITAEIAARVALDASCFRGGDTGHRQQVQDKINMMNRCYRFFTNSNCPPELITAMEVVVEQARAVIAATAAVVAIALVVAIIALIEVIAALIAAAAAATAEAAAAAAALASVAALLTLVTDEISPEEPPGA